MKKRLWPAAIAFAAAAVLVAQPALAAQTQEEIDNSVATYDQLVELVDASVDAAYAGLTSTLDDLVAGTIQSAIGNPQAVIDLATPLIKSTIKGAIAAYIQDSRIDALVDQAVDSVATSQLLGSVLNNDFAQAVLARTVDYAVADVIAALQLDADKAQTAANLVNQVWTAPLVSVGTAPTKAKGNLGSPVYALGVGVNTTYYNYNVTAWNQRRVVIVNVNDTPKEITVTGWNSGNINLLASGTAYVSAASKADSIAATLANLDYVSIFLDAGQRALVDEIEIRINQAIQCIKTALLTELQNGLASIGVAVTLDPLASWESIGATIREALRTTAQDQLNAALAKLPWVVTPGTPDETFCEALQRVATDAATYIRNWVRNIDWLALFRGSGSSAPQGPSLSVSLDRKAMTNTDTVGLTVTARDANGVIRPAAELGATITYSLGESCQFPAGQAPSRRTCTVTVQYDGMTAAASVEVFDPSALAAPIGGQAIPGAKLTATTPDGWPTVTRSWTRNGKAFSTATSYTLPKTEKLGNTIALTQTLKYQGLTISGTSPALTVAVGGPATLKLTPVAKAITNAGGAQFTVVAKDAQGNTIAGVDDQVVYSYSLGDGCSFPTGQAPSRRTCTVTGTLGAATATASVEVFDPSALAAPIGGQAIPGAKLTATAPEGWPTVTRSWTRNGKAFSTATTYTLPKTEALGNAIALTQTLKYQGLTISGTSPALTVAVGAPATVTLTATTKAITNAGGAQVTAVVKDTYGNVIPAGAGGTALTYSLGDGCSFPTGQEPSRRTCTVTGTFGGVSGTATVEVFDPSALAAPIDGAPNPGSTLKAQTPAGWPTVTRSWTRNGKAFSTAATYRLPSTEKVGNVIELTQTLKYQGLTISGTSPALVVTK